MNLLYQLKFVTTYSLPVFKRHVAFHAEIKKLSFSLKLIGFHLILYFTTVILTLHQLPSQSITNLRQFSDTTGNTLVNYIDNRGKLVGSVNSLVIPAQVDLSDTLGVKRRLFKTDVFSKGEKLSNTALIMILKDTKRAQRLIKIGNILKPIAGLMALSGLISGYLGIKGTEETAMIHGIRTTTNPNVPDVQVQYIKRSLPKVMGGIGFLIGSMCLLELSNECTIKSVVLYNTKSVSQKSISQIRLLKVGLTTSGHLGIEAHL